MNPDETTEYTLTATNNAGSVTAKTTVTVESNSELPEESEGNRAEVERMLGTWVITYSIGNTKFTDNFVFSRLIELLPGDFVAVGPDRDVQAGYHLGDEFIDAGYYIFDAAATVTGTDQSYNFEFISENTISGTTFLSPFLEPSSDRYPFKGVRE